MGDSPVIIIPLITLATAILGSIITASNMGWYKTLLIPPYTPSGSVIGAIWTTLFILATISALLVWKRAKKVSESLFRWRVDVSIVFALNALLNVWWSVLFFGFHQPFWAIWDAAALGITVAMLIRMIWVRSKFASLLLVPYLFWVAFATHLTYTVWVLNK